MKPEHFIRDGYLGDLKQGLGVVMALPKSEATLFMSQVLQIAALRERQLRDRPAGSQKISDAKDLRKNAEYLLGIADGVIEPPSLDSGPCVVVSIAPLAARKNQRNGGLTP